MTRAPTPPLPGFHEADLPKEPDAAPPPKKRPHSPRQVRRKVDRFGKPKERRPHGKVFADGNDVVILKVTDKGVWQRLPEPTSTAPMSGVPRFQTRPAAYAWLRGQGASMLGGSQVAVVRMLDVMFVEVVQRPMVSLIRRPKYEKAATSPETALESTREDGGMI